MTLFNRAETLTHGARIVPWPEGDGEFHPRAIEMADKMREAAGTFGSVTFADLIQAGFTSAEIIEHEAAARRIAQAGFVRQVAKPGDRVPDIIAKAIAAASHVVPVTAGTSLDEAMIEEWGRFCTARAAWKLDPWAGQGERCLNRLNRFLDLLPLLPREKNRVLCGLAAHMKAHRHG